MIGLSIPLYNEEALVERVVDDMVGVLRSARIPYCLALVDNGSRDRTQSLIEGLIERDEGLISVHLPVNAGYGGGILQGIHRLLEDPAIDILGWSWGDGQVSPEVLPGLYKDCQRGSPVAKVRRTKRHTSWRRRAVAQGYQLTTRALGLRCADVNGCPKLFRREALLELSPRSTDWFLDAEVIIGAEARGWAIAERPSPFTERAAGESKVRLSTIGEFVRNLGAWKLRS